MRVPNRWSPFCEGSGGDGSSRSSGEQLENVTMDPPSSVSLARSDRIYISQDDILASGGVRVRPLRGFSPLPPGAPAPPVTGDRAPGAELVTRAAMGKTQYIHTKKKKKKIPMNCIAASFLLMHLSVYDWGLRSPDTDSPPALNWSHLQPPPPPISTPSPSAPTPGSANHINILSRRAAPAKDKNLSLRALFSSLPPHPFFQLGGEG